MAGKSDEAYLSCVITDLADNGSAGNRTIQTICGGKNLFGGLCQFREGGAESVLVEAADGYGVPSARFETPAGDLCGQSAAGSLKAPLRVASRPDKSIQKRAGQRAVAGVFEKCLGQRTEIDFISRAALPAQTALCASGSIHYGYRK